MLATGWLMLAAIVTPGFMSACSAVTDVTPWETTPIW